MQLMALVGTTEFYFVSPDPIYVFGYETSSQPRIDIIKLADK